MSRIVVIGTSCSGKTTFARRIAAVCRIPHVELDELHWLPNWTPRPLDEFRQLVQDAASQPEWVIDGNYGKARDLIWPRATDIVWLNLPFRIVFWRAISRSGRRWLRREELFGGNRESLRTALFDPEGIPWWVIRTYHRRRREYRQLLLERQGLPYRVYDVRATGELERILAALCFGRG